MRQLDIALGSPSRSLDIIVVGGSNGKSSTIQFASQLLREEKFKVGACYSSHFLTYNERIVLNTKEQISNKNFSEYTSQVIATAAEHNIEATAFEISLATAISYFAHQKVDVVILEVGIGGRFDPTTAFTPRIAAVTRVAQDHVETLGTDLDDISCEMVEIAKPGTWLIAAEQSKLRLQKMKTHAESLGILWSMPIRKLAALPYIYEQLYGRSASLGERIAQVYTEKIKDRFSPFLRGNLLATKQGQRGRPTLAAKRQAELHPIKTLKSFWEDNFHLPRGRFEVLDKEKPTVLVDNSRNLDALENLFLGIRLLNYRHPLEGLVIILGLSRSIPLEETLKKMRYLIKKVGGRVFFVNLPGAEESYSAQELCKEAELLGITSKAFQSVSDAFNEAKDAVDDRHGLVAIGGSEGIVRSYWRAVRGMKKF
jgi:dihydrofolate synthase/folylpolyglutamate synthase